MGVHMGSHRFAISATDVLALFHADAVPDTTTAPPLDVVIHGGAPVFIVPLGQLFELPRLADTAQMRGTWILVRRLSSGLQLGCRVDQVQGPLSGRILDGEVLDGEIAWTVIHAKKEKHG
jgi:hypothetical protein